MSLPQERGIPGLSCLSPDGALIDNPFSAEGFELLVQMYQDSTNESFVEYF